MLFAAYRSVLRTLFVFVSCCAAFHTDSRALRMAILPAPQAPCTLTFAQVQAFDAKIARATDDDIRACSNCGVMAFGHEPHWQNFRAVSPTDTNQDAAALSECTAHYCRHTEQNHPDRVWHCQECNKGAKHAAYRRSLVPQMPQGHAEALSTAPYTQLHATSFVDISYKLTDHRNGYVDGEFAAHSLVHGPLLEPGDAPMDVDPLPQMATVWANLVHNSMLYQLYTPVAYREGVNALARRLVATHRPSARAPRPCHGPRPWRLSQHCHGRRFRS